MLKEDQQSTKLPQERKVDGTAERERERDLIIFTLIKMRICASTARIHKSYSFLRSWDVKIS